MNENIIENIIGKREEYVTINPGNFDKGHGGTLSVKIVLPCYCQAHCSFCFNNNTINTSKHDYEEFFKNLSRSLDMIFQSSINRKISLDITGNEPTFDIEIFSRLMQILKKYKSKISKIVLTTNGFHLEECVQDMEGVVDIVNISVHHYDYLERLNIFKTIHIPDDEKLKRVIKDLDKHNITATSVAVLYQKLDNFNEFYDKFKKWSIKLGFKDARLRSNFCATNNFVDDILKVEDQDNKIERQDALITKIVVDKETQFKTYILIGVPDLTEYVIGPELVIDDDGLCYVDYNKRYKVDKNNIKYFNNIYNILREENRKQDDVSNNSTKDIKVKTLKKY